jgi:UDP-N-acetyl-D-glucosamine dehydrogenase
MSIVAEIEVNQDSFSALKEKIQQKALTVGVIGLGYVGLPFLVEKAKIGLRVIGFDNNQACVDQLLNKKSHIDDISDEELEKVFEYASVDMTTDMRRLSEADVLIICVPTPLDKNQCPDLSFVESVCQSIKKYIRKGQLISLESTTYPGTTEELIKPILEESGLKAGSDFFLSYSPERVDPGNARYTTKNTNKVVGADDERSLEVASKFYKLAIEHVVPVSSSKTAELVKVYENTFRAVNIALANQMALLCHKMDIDVWEMLDAAFTKPFGIMPFYPGPGVGGHCIPIDPHYLEWKAKEYGFNTRLINLAGEINRSMPAFVVQRVQELLNKDHKSLNGAKIFIVGVTYKADLADCRESPAMDVIKLLEAKGAEINYFDPLVDSFELGSKRYKKTGMDKDTLFHQDCVIVLAKHNSVDYNFIKQNSSLVFDTRNVFSGRSNIETL